MIRRDDTSLRAEGLEWVPCPYCGHETHTPWATELEFVVVRCSHCRLLFVNPRPSAALIDAAVRTGVHQEAGGLNVTNRHSPRRMRHYRRLLGRMFADVWSRNEPISWLDVGAGYGEVVEAVVGLAPARSNVVGLEPMKPKAEHARARGLAITEDYLRPTGEKVDFLSTVDVFSHIPQFDSFLAVVVQVLKAGGEFYLETGNLADVEGRSDFPGELGVPDHLVFAGEQHVRGFLERAGFQVVRIETARIDDLVNAAKCIVKKVMGKPTQIALPYRSPYRQLLVRAKLVKAR